MQTELLQDEEFDVIVAGAGMGGAIAAARIAQFGVNPRNGEKLKIALFEWGPYYKGDALRGYGIAGRRGAFDGMPYELERRYMLPWGTLGLVGGASHWAGMIAYPPTPIDFEHWRAETDVDWTWEKFNLPLAELYEMWHPYPEPKEVRSPGQERFREAALAVGYDVGEMGQAKLNCPRCGDCNGRFCKYDAKSNAMTTYIPIAERYGVRIVPQAAVDKIVIEKKGSRPAATGVHYRLNGEMRRARAANVIVSCGYNGTARLLYRSGYGPRNKVQGELFAENRNVGSNVIATISARHIEAWFDEPLKHPDVGVHTVYYVEKVGHHGYNRLGVAESFGTREGTGDFPPDHALSEIAPHFGREFKEYMKQSGTHIGNIRIEMSKTGIRGEVNTDGQAVFGGVPNIRGGSETGLRLEYLQKNHPEVLEGFHEGHEIGRKIVNYMKPRKVYGPDQGIGERFTLNQPLGSCRAGASTENSVVNSDLESHDVDNLFISDGSVVPVQGTCNPTMPIAAICNHGWRRIVAKHFSRGGA